MAICKRLLLVAFLLLCFISITATGKFFFFLFFYMQSIPYQHSKVHASLIFCSFWVFLQQGICQRLEMKLQRDMSIGLNQTKIIMRRWTVMNQCLWITLLQKRILPSITNMIKYQFSLSIDLIAALVLGVYMFVEEGCENFGKFGKYI